ncbi:hypothetical protein NQ318_022772 [Aromia moschata]|uniref:DDE Tnp4 domain-containing protein n=1 Tax=Aromia moschata TaxID=1265417 RepID=A0AAV8YDN7_9CUCU|nr:hypothetical protein NQ318_022772 [Aromia moschata]
MSDFESSEESEVSEFSDLDTDTDLENLIEERIRPKYENYIDETVVQFNREVFIEHFRVSREVANDISQRFAVSEYYKQLAGPYGKLTALQYTSIFLWYAGHQTASFRDVVDRFNVTISVLHKIIKRMTYFLKKQEIEQYFRHKNRFPGIIGLIDGTHIKIDKPRDDPASYINRNGVLFDSDRGLLDRPQINYNMQHSSNRIKIKHCNGVLKQKWRQLYHTKLKEIRLIVNFIRACCVLHNLGLQDGVIFDLEPNEENAEPIEVGPNLDPDNLEQDIQEDVNAIEK